jgi:hypothetical protein
VGREKFLECNFFNYIKIKNHKKWDLLALKKNFDRYFPEEMKNFSRRTGLQIHFRAT